MSDDMSQMTCDSHQWLSLRFPHIAELIYHVNLITHVPTRPPLPQSILLIICHIVYHGGRREGGGKAANKGCNNKVTFTSGTQGRFYWMKDMNFIGCQFH